MPVIQARIASVSAGGAVVAVEEEAVALAAGLPESPDPSEQAASVSSTAAVDSHSGRYGQVMHGCALGPPCAPATGVRAKERWLRCRSPSMGIQVKIRGVRIL